MGRMLLTLGLLCVFATGCNTDSDTQERLMRLRPASGAYEVAFVHPPWDVIEQNGDLSVLEIEGEILGLNIQEALQALEEDIDPDAVPPRFRLTVSVESGSAKSRANSDAAEAGGLLRAVDGEPFEVVTDSGDVGQAVVMVSLAPDGRWFRNVYFDRNGGVVRFAFEAFARLDTAEIEALIQEFKIDPEG